jgi:hypothetical protein
VTITTVRAAIQLIHEPEIDSLWEYEDCDEKSLWAAYTKGQLCDLRGSSTALKHYGEITGMGKEFLDTHKFAFQTHDYPVSPETKRWWEGKRDCDPQKFSDRYYVKLLTQVIDRECNEALDALNPASLFHPSRSDARRSLKNMLAESAKAKRMLKESSDAMEETTWED